MELFPHLLCLISQSKWSSRCSVWLARIIACFSGSSVYQRSDNAVVDYLSFHTHHTVAYTRHKRRRWLRTLANDTSRSIGR